MSVYRKVISDPLQINFSWAFIGNLVYAVCQWAILAALAQLGSPETVGQFALALSITAPIIMFANLELRNIQATDSAGKHNFREYLSLRMIMCAIAVVIIFGVAIIGGFKKTTLLVIFIMGIAKAVESISDIYHGYFQKNERMDIVAAAKIIKGILSLAALVLGVYFFGITVGVSVLLFVWLFVLLGYEQRKKRILSPYLDDLSSSEKTHFINFQKVKSLWFKSLPMGFGALLLSLNGNVPRLFIEYELGAGALGIFAAVAYFQVAGTIIVRALVFAISPRLARAYASDGHLGFVALQIKMVGVGVIVGALGILFANLAGEKIMQLIYGLGYAEYSYLLVWMMAASMMHFIAMFLECSLIVIRRFRCIMVILAIVVGSTTLACFILVPNFGMLGGIWAIGIGASVHVMGDLLILIYSLRKEKAVTKSDMQTAATAL